MLAEVPVLKNLELTEANHHAAALDVKFLRTNDPRYGHVIVVPDEGGGFRVEVRNVG